MTGVPTIAEARRAVGILETDESADSILQGNLDAARATVMDYAPDAPDAVAKEATLRMVGHLHLGFVPRDARGRVDSFRHSGAENLLARWRKRRGVVIA